MSTALAIVVLMAFTSNPDEIPEFVSNETGPFSGVSAPVLAIIAGSNAETVSLEDLFANREKYQDKVVQVRGRCTKVNNMIMGRNWVHIQDGTGSPEPHDLTVTTSAKVAVGDEVTFEGRVTLDKDFGSGYFYAVIMEDAKLVKE